MLKVHIRVIVDEFGSVPVSSSSRSSPSFDGLALLLSRGLVDFRSLMVVSHKARSQNFERTRGTLSTCLIFMTSSGCSAPLFSPCSSTPPTATQAVCEKPNNDVDEFTKGDSGDRGKAQRSGRQTTRSVVDHTNRATVCQTTFHSGPQVSTSPRQGRYQQELALSWAARVTQTIIASQLYRSHSGSGWINSAAHEPERKGQPAGSEVCARRRA